MKKMFALFAIGLNLSLQGYTAELDMHMMKNKVVRHHDMDQNKQRCFIATGVVRKIDRDNGIVTIFYDAVLALMWPPMTMPFAVRDDALFERFKIGEWIEFEFVLEEKTGVIVAIK